jgi:hypothetical protein
MPGRALDRLVIGALEGCCRQMWGFSPRMVSGIVRAKGALPALAWFAGNMPRYLMTMYRMGPMRTHLACAAISLHNDCLYCAFGQTYALELIYLRDAGRLFPLDARCLEDWMHLHPRQLTARLLRVLHEAGLHTEAAWVELAVAFATGEQQPIDAEEVRLARLVGIVTEMNRMAIAGGFPPDGAQDPVNKDEELKARHAALRRAAPSP